MPHPAAACRKGAQGGLSKAAEYFPLPTIYNEIKHGLSHTIRTRHPVPLVSVPYRKADLVSRDFDGH